MIEKLKQRAIDKFYELFWTKQYNDKQEIYDLVFKSLPKIASREEIQWEIESYLDLHTWNLEWI